ncbi:uncharacterized protein LOC119402035 [Rhipicephalus sanguineus]|uniref:uncharacterized protein LOC119402035 n=1 Tax=Rhipicephalus sanguineus TaxID=34632 RepID=UPI0020C24C50|nr:uncharacterized protein LOC119402035 [Rhipicephalus sanguineus]
MAISGFAKQDMAAVDASVVLIVLLMSFGEESFASGRWTEAIPANTALYRSLARFAYQEEKHGSLEGLTYLVTQARWKRVGAQTIYHIGFIVLENNMLLEKCITLIKTPPALTGARMRSVTKFWCRPVVV